MRVIFWESAAHGIWMKKKVPMLRLLRRVYLLDSLFTRVYNWWRICLVQPLIKGTTIFSFKYACGKCQGFLLRNTHNRLLILHNVSQNFLIWKTHKSTNNRELSDTIMNVVGAFMWVSVGATAIHYWQGYIGDHDQLTIVHERTVSIICLLPIHNPISIHQTPFSPPHVRNVYRLVWYLVHFVFYLVLCTLLTVYWHSFILQNEMTTFLHKTRIKKYFILNSLWKHKV